MPNAFKPEERFPAFSREDMIPLIDMNAIKRFLGVETDGDGHAWTRVDKSEIDEITFDAQTETKKYIDTKNDYTYINSYNMSEPQEIITDGNNECYSLLYEYSMHRPTGSDAEVPCMQLFPSVMEPGKADAFLFENAMLVPGTINFVDKKLTFTMQFNGDMQRGIGEKDETTGRFKYTEVTDEDKDDQVETLSAKSVTTTAKKSTFAADSESK